MQRTGPAAVILALLVCISFSASTAAFHCTGLPNGYYCISASTYEQCTSESTSLQMNCSRGTICKCGFVPETSDPCVSELDAAPEGCSGTIPYLAGREAPILDARRSLEIDGGSVEILPAVCSGLTDSSATASGSLKVITYVTNNGAFRKGDCKFEISYIDGNTFSHLNFAFAKLNSNFEVIADEKIDNSEGGLYDQLMGLKVKYPHLKIVLSLGGWGFNANANTEHIFSDMASTRSSRATFINSVIAWVRRYGFDGIDIDWEFPAYVSQGGRPEDKPNFTFLLQELRAAIDAEMITSGQRLLLTIALPASKSAVQGYELEKIHQYLDWFNLMAYDLHGGWEKTTNFHTALYDEDDDSIDWAVTNLLTNGVPSEKIVMGLATYGKTWTLSSESENGPRAPASGVGVRGTCTSEAGVLSYFEIKEFIASGAVEVYDDKAKAAYAYKNKQWIGYDNPRSMEAKAAYIKEKKLGGGMFWSIDLDGPRGKFNELQCVIARSLFNIGDHPVAPALPMQPIISNLPPNLTPLVVASSEVLLPPLTVQPLPLLPTEQAPIQQVPVEQTPIQQVPVEQTPTLQSPTERTPTPEAAVTPAIVPESPVSVDSPQMQEPQAESPQQRGTLDSGQSQTGSLHNSNSTQLIPFWVWILVAVGVTTIVLGVALSVYFLKFRRRSYLEGGQTMSIEESDLDKEEDEEVEAIEIN